eukprot:CAMPEP_0173414786 /NCGR_PEP_ID=MMETSP1356-20130122/84506_1 /TAXON_ID=77927 ORGANISM="Hemiselmis virescens, Strain PCC157" /NCGR_SAMPLE_ID=MMETSP1356 /ASSEMBLY_ACC=CAM_ASM_000847 /LENGTH=109 /DNA_ID=CAMNT_0014376989 /DNA_START=497 /DNA_END=828 /DNA_ORIENTATION=-
MTTPEDPSPGAAPPSPHKLAPVCLCLLPALDESASGSRDPDVTFVAVVEVVPLVAGTAPVIVGRGVVGAVVGVLGLLVQGAGLGVLDERLGVEVGPEDPSPGAAPPSPH